MAAADQAKRLDRPPAAPRKISARAADSDQKWIDSPDPDGELAALALVKEQFVRDRLMRKTGKRT